MFSKIHTFMYLESEIRRQERDLENERHTFDRVSLRRCVYFGKHNIQEYIFQIA